MITESDKIRAQAYTEIEGTLRPTVGRRMAPENPGLADYIDDLRLELEVAAHISAELDPEVRARIYGDWRSRCIKLLATQPEQVGGGTKNAEGPKFEVPYTGKVETMELREKVVDTVLATIRERGKIYGDPALSHHNIGLSWTGLIQQHYGMKLDHPLPDWLVELMLVAFKVHRAARVYHSDNYVDARAYLKFAEEDQRKAAGGEVGK